MEIYNLNQQLFEFEREQEVRLDVQPVAVVFNNEGTVIADSSEDFIYIGKVICIVEITNRFAHFKNFQRQTSNENDN